MQGHIAGHTNAVAQIAQPRRRTRRRRAGLATHQVGQGTGQGLVESGAAVGIDGQQAMAVFQHPSQGLQGRAWGFKLAGFQHG